jgi:hypothetical protein
MTTEEIMARIGRGMRRAIAKEVAMLRREGYPIIVSRNGKITDINKPRRRRGTKKGPARKRLARPKTRGQSRSTSRRR